MGNCVGTKDKQQTETKKVPVQEPVLETKKLEPAQTKPEATAEQTQEAESYWSYFTTANDNLKANGLDIGKLSQAAITTMWENCTQENLDKLTKMVKDSNETLLANGIDVKGLTAQAGSAMAQASVLLAAKMWQDAQELIKDAYKLEACQSLETEDQKKEFIQKYEAGLKDAIRASAGAKTVEEQ